jgi:hypothetical protein
MFSRSPEQSTLSLRSRAALPTTEAHEIQNEIPVEPPILLRYKLRSRNWATLLPVTNPECSGV